MQELSLSNVKLISDLPLPDEIKALIIYTLNAKAINQVKEELTTYSFPADELRFAIEECVRLYNDLQGIDVSPRTYSFLFYYIFRWQCRFDSPEEKKRLFEGLIKSTLFNKEFREAVKLAGTNSSGYIYFMQIVTPLIDELEALMLTTKNADGVVVKKSPSYQVIKKHREIIGLCDRDFLPEGVERDAVVQELKKRYGPPFGHEKVCAFYKNGIAEPRYVPTSPYKLSEQPVVFEDEGINTALRSLLHKKMLVYHEETGFLFRPYNENINIYYMGAIVVVAYKYDDVPGMVLKSSDLMLGWQDLEFWTKITDSKMVFHEGRYKLATAENGYEEYQVEHTGFLKTPFMPFDFPGKTVIYAPEDALDEAIRIGISLGKGLTFSIRQHSKLRELGWVQPLISSAALLTADSSFIFKDPSKVDALKLSNPQKAPALVELQANEKGFLRDFTLDEMRRKATKNPKPRGLPPGRSYSGRVIAFSRSPYAGSADE